MKAAFRLPRKRCPRVYLCARSSRSTSALLPSSPSRRPSASSPFLASLCLSPSALFRRSRILFSSLYIYAPLLFAPFLLRYIFFSAIFEQLTFHRSSSCLSSFSTSLLPPPLHLSPPRRSFSRALSRRGVNSSLEHGQQDNACLLKTSF